MTNDKTEVKPGDLTQEIKEEMESVTFETDYPKEGIDLDAVSDPAKSGKVVTKRISAQSAELAKTEGLGLSHLDRMSRYIHHYLHDKNEDGTRITKKEAALRAGYAESTANNISDSIENSVGFPVRLKDYIQAHPDVDIRAEIVEGTLRDMDCDDPKIRLENRKYITEILGEFAPKRSESKSVSVKATLPERK